MNESIKASLTETGVALTDTALGPFGLGGIAQSFYSARKLVTAIAEQAYQEKLTRFIKGIEAVSIDDRRAFGNLLDEDKEAFFKRLILILDRLEDVEKAEIIGRLFRATITMSIDVSTFNRLAGIVDKTFLQDLNYLKETFGSGIKIDMFQPNLNDNHSNAPLVAVGLLIETKPMGGLPPLDQFGLTPLGKVLLDFGY